MNDDEWHLHGGGNLIRHCYSKTIYSVSTDIENISRFKN